MKDKAGDTATNELGGKLGTRWKTQGGSIAKQMDTKLGDKVGNKFGDTWAKARDNRKQSGRRNRRQSGPHSGKHAGRLGGKQSGRKPRGDSHPAMSKQGHAQQTAIPKLVHQHFDTADHVSDQTDP